MRSAFKNYCNVKNENCHGYNISLNKQNCWRFTKQKYKSLEYFYSQFPIITFKLDNDYDYRWKP